MFQTIPSTDISFECLIGSLMYQTNEAKVSCDNNELEIYCSVYVSFFYYALQ